MWKARGRDLADNVANVPDAMPPPRYVGYPRNNEVGVPGLYGSSKRLEGLRYTQKLIPWFGAVLAGLTVSLLSSYSKHWAPIDLFMLALLAVPYGLLFYGVYDGLSRAKGFSRGWAILAGVIGPLNPILWSWFAPHGVRTVGCCAVVLALALPIGFMMRSEAKRYGFKYDRKHLFAIDELIAHRRVLETAPPQVPPGLYSGEAPGGAITS